MVFMDMLQLISPTYFLNPPLPTPLPLTHPFQIPIQRHVLLLSYTCRINPFSFKDLNRHLTLFSTFFISWSVFLLLLYPFNSCKAKYCWYRPCPGISGFQKESLPALVPSDGIFRRYLQQATDVPSEGMFRWLLCDRGDSSECPWLKIGQSSRRNVPSLGAAACCK